MEKPLALRRGCQSVSCPSLDVSSRQKLITEKAIDDDFIDYDLEAISMCSVFTSQAIIRAKYGFARLCSKSLQELYGVRASKDPKETTTKKRRALEVELLDWKNSVFPSCEKDLLTTLDQKMVSFFKSQSLDSILIQYYEASMTICEWSVFHFLYHVWALTILRNSTTALDAARNVITIVKELGPSTLDSLGSELIIFSISKCVANWLVNRLSTLFLAYSLILYNITTQWDETTGPRDKVLLVTTCGIIAELSQSYDGLDYSHILSLTLQVQKLKGCNDWRPGLIFLTRSF